MPPDVSTLKPSEARSLCRFCLQPQLRGTLQPPMVQYVNGLANTDENDRCLSVRSWPDSEMGLLYAQLTGGEQLHIVGDIVDDNAATIPPLSDGWCSRCPERLRQAIEVLRSFREANAFWQSYALAWKGSIGSRRSDVAGIKLETDFKLEHVDGLPLGGNNDGDDGHNNGMDEHRLANPYKYEPLLSDGDDNGDDRFGGTAANDDDDENDDDNGSDVNTKPTKKHRTRKEKSTVPKPKPTKRGPKPKSAAPKAAATAAVAEKKHDGEICHICGSVYKIARCLQKHMETSHSRLECDLCGRTFYHKVPLRRHFRVDHSFARFTCDGCNMPDLTLSIWKRHQERHGPKVPRYSCDHCGNTYSVQNSLRQHIALTHVVKEVACPDCGKVFQNAQRLSSHAIRHRPKGLTCPEDGCPRMFWRTREMKEHVRTVHRKIRKYECTMCDKKFLMNAQLKKHHAGGRCPGMVAAATAAGGDRTTTAVVAAAAAAVKMETTTATIAAATTTTAMAATTTASTTAVCSDATTTDAAERPTTQMTPHDIATGEQMTIMTNVGGGVAGGSAPLMDGGPMQMPHMHPQLQLQHQHQQQLQLQQQQLHQHQQYQHQQQQQHLQHQSPLSSLWSAMLHRR